jgi:hypothetical protein
VKINKVITQWQLRYPGLKEELEGWKKEPVLVHDTISLHHRNNEIECVFLRICDSEDPYLLYCVSVSKKFAKQNKMSKVLNNVFKYDSERNFNQLLNTHPKTIAALMLSGDGGLRILWH